MKKAGEPTFLFCKNLHEGLAKNKGRRTYADYTEQQANQRELDELLQQTADQVIAHGSSGDAPEQQPEVSHQTTRSRSKEAQAHDEAR